MSQRQTRPEAPSRTQVTTESPEERERERSLRLVGQDTQPEQPASRPRVTWTDETVDNEHLNRKKSKICCIFHPADEDCCESSADEEYSSPSSSSSSSSSSSESDSDSDASEVPAGDRHRHRHRREPRPNAYERQPKLRPRRHAH